MTDYLLYGIGFLICTIIIQYVSFKIRKDSLKNKFRFWTGVDAIFIICVMGIIQAKPEYLAAIAGFILADKIGENYGWH